METIEKIRAWVKKTYPEFTAYELMDYQDVADVIWLWQKRNEA